MRRKSCFYMSLYLFVFTVILLSSCQNSPTRLAEKIIQETNTTGGLVVHLGCGEGKLTAALGQDERVVVQGLDRNEKNVQIAGKYFRSKGLYGKVSVAVQNGKRLPYADNLVNLLVSESDFGLEEKEIMRVLRPKGVAYLYQNGVWQKHIKPWPNDIDEWTHFLHGPDNNAVAQDRVVGPPAHLQWKSGPLWTRDHDVRPTIFSPVTANGRLFYIQDEGPVSVIDKRLPEKFSLIARDAFNGVLLWKRPMQDWYSHQVIWGHIPIFSQRRLVATDDRLLVTLGMETPVSAIDAVTGKIIQTFSGTEHTSEILCVDDYLVLVKRVTPATDGLAVGRERIRFRKGYQGPQGGGQALMVLRKESGDILWQQNRHCLPLTVAAHENKLYFSDEQHVNCLDIATGEQIWQVPYLARTLVVQDNVVLMVSERKRADKTVEIKAISATDGTILWSRSGDCLPNFYLFYAPVDLYVANGLVWGLAENLEWNEIPGSGYLLGLDLKTGAIKEKISLQGAFTTQHHVRCYKGKATERYLLFNKRGIEFLNIDEQKNALQYQWVRGVCRYGILPANGLIYAPTHGCRCYPGAQLQGFNVLASDSEFKNMDDKSEQTPVIEKGPAFSKPVKSSTKSDDEWSTFRHDFRRSGSSQMVVPADLRKAWSVQAGKKLSAPTIANNRVFVADIDAHQVCAFNASDGRLLWRFTTGARVDSPPTIAKSRVVFGCRDGWVYCLDETDGRLIWRFRDKPLKNIIVSNQLESAWPVHGSVLVKDDIVYFAAGRSSFLDGGIDVYGLELTTGAVQYHQHISGPDGNKEKLEITSGRMPGALPDILTSDGKHLYMKHVQLDPHLSQNIESKDLNWDMKSDMHFKVQSGFLDDTYFNRTDWEFGDKVKKSQMLVFDNHAIYGLRLYWGISWNCPIYEVGEGNLLFSRPLQMTTRKTVPEEELKKLFRIPYENFDWHTRVPLRIRAMVLTGASNRLRVDSKTRQNTEQKKLFMTGVLEEIRDDDPFAMFEGRTESQLYVLSAKTGEKLADYTLDAPPVWDGMAVAYGKLFIASMDGNLTCMAQK